jgi:hypothetical protein
MLPFSARAGTDRDCAASAIKVAYAKLLTIGIPKITFKDTLIIGRF